MPLPKLSKILVGDTHVTLPKTLAATNRKIETLKRRYRTESETKCPSDEGRGRFFTGRWFKRKDVRLARLGTQEEKLIRHAAKLEKAKEKEENAKAKVKLKAKAKAKSKVKTKAKRKTTKRAS